MRGTQCRSNLPGRGKQSGYLLLPVAVAIALIGLIAFLISSESAVEVELTAGELQAARAEYVAQAGLQHALRHHAQQGCGPYSDLTAYPFGSDEYDTTLSHDLGSTASYSIAVDQDTWIRDNQPTVNNGSDSQLFIRDEGGVIERALLRYDLSSIPAGAAILSARAWFYVAISHPEGPVDIHRVTADWNEADATWDSMSTNQDASIITGIPAQPTLGIWVSANLTSQVQAWMNGEPNYGIVLDSSSEGVQARYNSRESTNPPYLEVIVGTPPTSPARLGSTSKIDGGGAAGIKREVTLIQQPPANAVLQLGTDPGEDAMLDSFYNLRNYGGANYMQVHDNESDWQQYPLIRFHLNRLPRGAVINSARLELRLTSLNAPGSAMVHQVTRDWVEGTRSGGGIADGANWGTYDGTNAWTTAGGDINSSVVAETAINGGETWVGWDVTQLVARWLSGIPNYGFLIKPDTALGQARFASKEDADPALRPRLTISYSCICGEICMTPQGSGNLLMVVINPTVLVAEDQKAKDLFESWGYTVSVISESANQSSYDTAVAANDVVFISETVNSNSVGTKLANVPIGVVSQDGDYNPDLGLASASAHPVGAAVNATDTDHYITRPFAAGSLEIYTAGMEQLTASGSLNAGQQQLADVAGVASLIALDAGAAMEGGGSAAGRRVMLPLGTRYRFDWDRLNANGRLLVQRALEWAKGTGGKSFAVLFPVGDPANLTTQQQNKKDLIEGWGHSVTLIATSEDQAAYDSAAAAVDVVYVPELGTTPRTELDTKVDDLPIGAVTEEARRTLELGGFSFSPFVTTDSINITDNTHYLSETLPTGSVQLSSSAQSMWVLRPTLASDLHVLGELNGTEPGFAYLETGEQLNNGNPAPSRRVKLPWGASDFDVGQLTAEGLEIMRRAIVWGAGGSILSLEPIAHWKLDETTGPTAADSIGGHDGTLANGPQWQSGLLQGGLVFDGADDTVDIGPDAALDNLAGGKVTLTAWIHATGWGEGSYGRIVDKSNSTFPSAGWAFELYGPNQALLFQHAFSGGLGSWNTPAGSISLDTWHHVALVYDGSAASNDPEIYIDGAAQTVTRSGSPSGSPTDDSATSFTIGNHAQSTVRTFDGTLDDIRLFDRLLSAAEIAELAIPPGPVAHWKLDETTGPTAVDSAGGHDGTWTNDPLPAPGAIDGGLDFDGSNDYVDAGSFDVSGSGITMMAWFNAEAIATDDGRIVSKASGPNEADAYWQLSTIDSGSNRHLRMRIKAGGTTDTLADSSVNLSTDTWYFAVATYDNASGAMKLYLDGVEIASGSHAAGGALDTNPAVPVAISANGTAERFFNGVLDDVRIYDRALAVGEINDLFDAVTPPGVAGYVEAYQPWSATSDNTWQAVDLGVLGVPANAVVEVAIVNSNGSRERWGGVRAVGSSLERRFWLHEAEAGGVDALTLHVQADSGSRIEHYSERKAEVTFILMGYWIGASYVELFDPFDASTSASWTTELLLDDGVGPNRIAEIAMINTSTSAERLAGIRASGSSLLRRFDLHEAESGGIDAVTLMVETSFISGIEVYAESNTEVDFYVLGYWATPPGTYTEFGGSSGRPTVSASWQARDLSSFGVPADSIAQFVISNDVQGTEHSFGARAVGSTQDRFVQLQEAEAGGSDLVTMHANVDSSSQVEWYSSAGAANGFFYPVGWWVLP